MFTFNIYTQEDGKHIVKADNYYLDHGVLVFRRKTNNQIIAAFKSWKSFEWDEETDKKSNHPNTNTFK